ncbi:hypothetical protein SARC_02485 [Sphaeroforma arctica JP610]|uniref:Uncharacterized protein n=1 Tax=Sphaeroforma arctica JP610 TaxID=667725 RepID=A0A0L0GAQ0_9EUKA|nr:hypothetical protein SARC_02485 [Sphaeroforma arctica JP610]KNC85338.1 hypothetical protein SARC_02485 [Sphaeroforma arctica JP610]|eukprot:XP_014159240.1 hypothetical protein SARC_02485 [Sphaeroforma arctica JP610]
MGTQSYRSYIHAVETHGLEAALRRARQEVASHSDYPKVAYLFLDSDGHSQDTVWQDFFEHADEDKYNIYVHRSYPTPEGGKNFLQKFSSYHETPIISSAWCALMGVQYALLAAALRDPTNQQFVFISHNTVPFKNFDFIYDDLIGNSMCTSKFCFASMMGSVYNDCHFFDTHRAQRADTLKHHQWIILSREHSQTVLYEQGRQSLNYYDSLRALKDGVYNDPQMCSDETVPSLALILKAKAEKKIVRDVPANVFNGLSSIGVEERCTTFAYWARCLQRTPFDLGEKFEARQGELWHPLSMSGIPEDYLIMLVNEPSLLFGRKFNEGAFVTTNNGSTINVADILPKIIHSGATFSAKALEERPLPRLNTALDGSNPVEGKGT